MSDVWIDIGLSEEQKAALEAMLAGFEESAKGEGMNGLHETINVKTELLKEKYSVYDMTNNIGCE